MQRQQETTWTHADGILLKLSSGDNRLTRFTIPAAAFSREKLAALAEAIQDALADPAIKALDEPPPPRPQIDQFAVDRIESAARFSPPPHGILPNAIEGAAPPSVTAATSAALVERYNERQEL